MSGDNGTYILETKGPEYRIARLQAVDNLYEEYQPQTETWTANIDNVINAFANSKVFTDLSEAWDAATNLDESLGSTEYGANLITQFKDFKFSDFEEQYAKKSKKEK